MMLRGLVAVVFLGIAAGCARTPNLPDTVISAASKDDFTRFRSELGTRFTPEQLKDFDTATQELQLDAMNRNVGTAASREEDMVRTVNGQTVQAVTLLGWQARRERFLREIATLTGMLERDLEQERNTAATGTPATVTARIQSEKEVIAKLQQNLAATERRLAELGTTKPPL